MRKKNLAMLLAIIMLFTMVTPAFAAEDEFISFAPASIGINTGNNVNSFGANNVVTADGFTTADLVAVWSGNANGTASIAESGNTGAVTYGTWVVNPSTTGTVSVSIEQTSEEQTVVFTLVYPNGTTTATVIVPALAHTHDYVVTDHKDATCTENGYNVYTCGDYDDEYTDIITATGHGATEKKVITEATCVTAGVMGIYCKDCNDLLDTEEIAINATNHVGDTYKDVITAATCEIAGIMGIYCSDCDALLDTEEIVAIGHSYIPVSATSSSMNLQNSTTVTLTVVGQCENCGTTITLASQSAKLKQSGTQTVAVGEYSVTVVVNSNNKITDVYVGTPAAATNGSQNGNSQGGNNQNGNSQGGNSKGNQQ